ncbi:MAG: hypothetical protein V3R94_06725 [Acidobacteriota bacterium]
MNETSHVFSVRNRDSIHAQSLGLLFSKDLREEIWAVLDQFNFAFDLTRDGQASLEIEVTDVLHQVGEEMERLYEFENPNALRHNGEALFLHMEGFLLASNAPQILDFVELFYHYLNDAHKLEFQRSINHLIEEENVSWRMKDGTFYALAPGPSLADVSRPSDPPSKKDLHEDAFSRFQKAQQDLESEDYSGALQSSCESLELVIEFLLQQTSKNGTFNGDLGQEPPAADLSRHLGLAFGDQLLNALGFLRNVLARNTQGDGPVQIHKAYAQLGVNLVSSVLFFAADLVLAEPLTENDFARTADFKQEGVA